MKYKVELTQTDEGWSAGCPDLPGCWSEGETEDEALENIKSAIKDYVEVIAEMNARKVVRYVEVNA